MSEAEELLRRLGAQGLTLATAESLTGGGLGELLTGVPGASASYVGGVIAYATRIKAEVLGVQPDVLEGPGVVSAECARAMAQAARQVLGADVGLATTGVAGPDAQEGKPVGLVYVAVATGSSVQHRELRLSGDRAAIRSGTLDEVLRLALTTVST